MSWKMMGDAYKAPNCKGTMKNVLMGLAFYANDDTCECYPSQGTLAADIGCSRRVVVTCISELERLGYVHHDESKGKGLVYKLTIPPYEISSQISNQPCEDNSQPCEDSTQDDVKNIHTGCEDNTQDDVNNLHTDVKNLPTTCAESSHKHIKNLSKNLSQEQTTEPLACARHEEKFSQSNFNPSTSQIPQNHETQSPSPAPSHDLPKNFRKPSLDQVAAKVRQYGCSFPDSQEFAAFYIAEMDSQNWHDRNGRSLAPNPLYLVSAVYNSWKRRRSEGQKDSRDELVSLSDITKALLSDLADKHGIQELFLRLALDELDLDSLRELEGAGWPEINSPYRLVKSRIGTVLVVKAKKFAEADREARLEDELEQRQLARDMGVPDEQFEAWKAERRRDAARRERRQKAWKAEFDRRKAAGEEIDPVKNPWNWVDPED